MTYLSNQTLTARDKTLFFMFTLVVAIVAVGCETASDQTLAPIRPLSKFFESGRQWKLVDGEPNSSDNKLIGTFFKKNSDLIGSPDWTGNPQKYVCDASSSLVRFYWFSGMSENATWNAVEFRSGRFRQLNGTGLPGAN